MSQNVEIFRRIIDAANDPDPAPALRPLLADDFYIENTTTAVTDKTYRGVDGCLAWVHDLSEAFAEGARCEVEAIVADTDEVVVGSLAFAGTGARSGASLQLRWVAAMWFRDGKATRCTGYGTRREALDAVGLAA